ncbi:MAG: TolB family protein, partial [Pseudomonadota bacterium]
MVNEQAVAYIQRPLILNTGSAMPVVRDRRQPNAFMPGARLYIKESAAPAAAAKDIASRAFPGDRFLDDDGRLRYDVRDLTVSHDGERLLFAMHAPVTGDEEIEPTWNIWEYDLGAGTLRRIIVSDTEADAAHDIAPAYLPDGSIVFASTRQRASRAILLDEGKGMFAAQDEQQRSPAFVLHVMAADGTDIRQITFNQSHDLDPVVLDNGRILFSRWDNAGQTANNGFNLYQVNPDGTGLAYVFGR